MAKLFLPSLPVCPYCKTIYRYGDVGSLVLKRTGSCYHCGKSFKISKKKLLILLLEFLILYALIDLFFIGVAKVTLVVLFIINVLLVAAGIVMIPYYIMFVEQNK